MAKRSLKASPAGILKAKSAFAVRGWTQEYLAAEVGLQTRQSVWKFFSGRPVERHIFIDLCFTLDLDWEDIVDRSAFVEGLPIAPPPADQADSATQLVALANHQCQPLEIPLAAQQAITLDQLYTEAHLRPLAEFGPAAPPCPAVAAVQPHPRVLILGQAGAGKTVVLQHLALECAAQRLGDGQGQSYLPVFLRLRQLSLLPVAELDLQTLLKARWQEAGVAAAEGQRLWQEERLWLFLDGWDELPPTHHGPVTQQLQTLLDTYPTLRLTLTGRSHTLLPQLHGLVTLELTPFSGQQTAQFVRQWFAANYPDAQASDPLTPDPLAPDSPAPNPPAPDGATLAQACLDTLAIPENDRLRDMALTPILLHLMCLVFGQGGEFPRQRSQLYQQALDLLLGQWDRQRGIQRSPGPATLAVPDVLAILAQVAAHGFERGMVVFPEAELLGLIARSRTTRTTAPPLSPEQLWAESQGILRLLVEHYGLLSQRELGTYAFSHLSFQEYLAARHRALTALVTPTAATDLATHLGDARWREVIGLTMEMTPDPAALWEALAQQSHAYAAQHPDLMALLGWVQTQAKHRAQGTAQAPVALRGFYLGLALNRGLDLATALDGALAMDLPPALERDQRLMQVLHQARLWLAQPTVQQGYNLVFAMNLPQRLELGPELVAALEVLQTQVVDAFEADTAGADSLSLATWCTTHGTAWLQALGQALATAQGWPADLSHLLATPALEPYHTMQRVLVDCLQRHQGSQPLQICPWYSTLLTVDAVPSGVASPAMSGGICYG